MSVTNVHQAIKRHLRTFTADICVSEGYTDGEFSAEFQEDVDITAAVFPLTDRELRYLPEGAYSKQDISIYQIGSGTLTNKSVLFKSSERFIVEAKSDRDFEGGFVRFLGKRQPVQ